MQIYNEDCVSGMTHRGGGQVDLILTDPPYNISVKNNFSTMNRKGIDFGEWDKGFDQLSWIKPACDMLKPSGSIIIFNNWLNFGKLADELEKNNCIVKNIIQWRKTNPMPKNRDRLYVTSCEFAIWAVKGKGWTFNRQRDTYENTIFSYAAPNGKCRVHPTQKPVGLMEDLILIHSNKGDVVLDPFMGSGTTGVAALHTYRDFIGYELDEKYYQFAKDRIIKETEVSA